MIVIRLDSFANLKLTLASGATALGSVMAATPSLIKLIHYLDWRKWFYSGGSSNWVV